MSSLPASPSVYRYFIFGAPKDNPLDAITSELAVVYGASTSEYDWTHDIERALRFPDFLAARRFMEERLFTQRYRTLNLGIACDLGTDYARFHWMYVHGTPG